MKLLEYTILLILLQNSANAQIDDEDDETEPLIVGGTDAKDGAYPYQISLQQFQQHICGGSIIGYQWILTAAHCVSGKATDQLTIVAGTNVLDGTGQRYQISNFVIHPNYDSRTSANDLAVVKTTRYIVFNERVKIIQLPRYDTPGGRQLVLTGWGKTSFPGQVSRTLKTIRLTSLSNGECQRSFPQVSSRNVCTRGISGRGACQGDSGGPLVDRYSLVGVVSYGVPCAKGQPDVFTRVYSFDNWIRSTTRRES